MRGEGVRVTAVCPGFTRTGAQRRMAMRFERVAGFLCSDAPRVAAS